jgi:hypothetical protein
LVELALLAAWVAALFAAFAFGKFNEQRTRYARRPVLMATSGLLVVMALVFWRQVGRDTAPYALLIALGMSASFVGDLIMGEHIRTPNRVIFGGVTFALAHAFYISAILSLASTFGIRLNWLLVLAVIAAGATFWAALVRATGRRSAMNYLMLVYMSIICVMAGLAVSMTLGVLGMWPLGVGALLFLASDVILLNQINRKNNWLLVSDVVWLLYISGQALIVWSNLPLIPHLVPT